MAVVGVLEFQMAADLARLSKDMTTAKNTVASTVAGINKTLGAIGVGLSVSFFTGMIKGVVDAADKMNDLKKITGLTITELAGLEKVAALNGSSLDQVSKAVGIMSKNIVAGSAALQSLGISSKQANGEFRTSNEVLLDVADRFATMRDGIQKTSIAQEIFGKSGRKLIPMLNEGRTALQAQIEAYGTASGFTQKLATDSDRFNDILVMLGGNVTATKNNFVSGLLPALNDIGAAFTKVSGSAQLFNAIGSGLGIALKGIVIAVATAAGAIKSLGFAIDGIGRQMLALINLDFKGAIAAGDKYFDNIAKTAKGNAEFIKSIIDGDKAIEGADSGRKSLLDFQAVLPTVTATATRAVEKQNKEFNMQLYLLKQYEDEARRARDITQSVATEQEIYNQKLEELNRLKPYLTIETYDRALAKLNVTNKQVAVSTQRTTDEVSQLWMQAGRNIQSTLANSIFNFFDDGLNGMVKNVAIAVGRIASEFAALRIAQSIGLAGMFGGGIGGTGGAGGGLSTAFNLASLTSGATNLFKTGFGATSLLSGAGGMLPGSAGSFFGGMGGGTVAGVSSPAALAGSSFAAAAGPAIGVAIAAMALDTITNKFAGDKTIGGSFGKTMQKIPVLGAGWDILAGFFGHGPMKFRQQSLQGTASSGGFDGDFTNVFRAKGGLLVKNKHKSVTEQLTDDQQQTFDTAIKGFYTSARGFAENLGLSTDLVDTFTQTLQIKSEKGKQLTEEAIAEMLTGIGNSLARNVIPAIDQFRKIGEDSFATFNRLNTEFMALKQGAINLGASAEYANKLVSSLGMETRTAYVEIAGGTDHLLELTSKFSANFLTEAERMAVPMKFVEDGLRSLGYSAEITKDQFGDLIQQLVLAGDETALLLLENQDLFLAVRQYKDALAGVVDATREASQALNLNDQSTNALARLQQSIDAEKTKLTDKYNLAVIESERRIKDVSDTIAKLADVSAALKSSVNSINPLSLEQARSQVMSGRSDSSNVKDAIALLGQQQSEAGFSNVLEFKRSTAANVKLLNGMTTKVDREMLLAQRSLAALEASRNALDDGFNAEIMRLDLILEDAKNQTASLQGIDIKVLSMVVALGELNRILLQGGQAGVPGGGGAIPVSGNPAISSADIVRFIDGNRDSPMAIYRAAIKNGVSSGQIAATGIYTQKQIDDFVKQNNLASFDVGGKVPSTGLAMVHKNEQVLTANESSNMSGQIEQLTKAVEVLTIANNKMNRRFDKWDSEGLPAERVA